MISLRIASRRSMLAMAQSGLVATAIQQAHPGADVQIVSMDTRGDRTAGELTPIGGKGLFTAELEEALRSGAVDLAVHSAKDLPVEMPLDMTIAAVPLREDARDALVAMPPAADDAQPLSLAQLLSDLPQRAVVGTSSPRRRAQLLAARSDLDVVLLRGNVETRIHKALQGPYDAVVLAMAGLNRSGLAGQYRKHIRPLPMDEFVPAAAQGALAIQTLAANESIRLLLAPLNDLPSQQALLSERHVLQSLGADCHSCLAVHIRKEPQGWSAAGMIAGVDGSNLLRCQAHGDEAMEAAKRLLEQLRP